MRILVLGSGGREHALVHRLKTSTAVEQVFCAPGNAGIAREVECVDLDIQGISPGISSGSPSAKFQPLFDWIERQRIDLTVVGPEAPLAAGLVDSFHNRFGSPARAQRFIFGPTQRAAQLESSKVFAKAFMEKYEIPTAKSRRCQTRQEVLEAKRLFGIPLVLKADGLAQGKGVWVCLDRATFDAALAAFFDEKRYGSAGQTVLVEEYLSGEEVSFLALCDGTNALALPSSQDHKRLLDGDQGPNTGGMGAYSPAPALNAALEKRVMEKVVFPVLRGMRLDGNPYVGILYVGLMLTPHGLRVLEFNCRFGDPEAQAILMRMDGNLSRLLMAAVRGELGREKIQVDQRHSVCVVLASKGYPEKAQTGFPITGLEKAKGAKNLLVFHAGTAPKGSDVVSDGGRVLGVTALGEDLRTALAAAYEMVAAIHFDGMQYRTDIGKKGLV